MKTPNPIAIASAAVGTAAAAASVAWLSLASESPRDAVPEQPREQAFALESVVCVGEDSILRAWPATPGCPAGQTPVPLTPETGEPDSPDVLEFDDEPAKEAESRLKDDPLADLERRVAALHKSPLFTVVDKTGNRVFTVAPETIRVFNRSGTAVATVNARNNGGFFAATSGSGALWAAVGAGAIRAGVRLAEGDGLRLDLGRHSTGTSSLKVTTPGSGDNPIAGVGASAAGTGALIVGDETGFMRASMTIADGKGAIAIYAASGEGIVSLRESLTGDGLLSIGDVTGREAVKMDVSEKGYGAVLAGPTLGLPLVTGSGLPGSYFLGCKGGDSCRPY